jgi:hypothetical protein
VLSFSLCCAAILYGGTIQYHGRQSFVCTEIFNRILLRVTQFEYFVQLTEPLGDLASLSLHNILTTAQNRGEGSASRSVRFIPGLALEPF